MDKPIRPQFTPEQNEYVSFIEEQLEYALGALESVNAQPIDAQVVRRVYDHWRRVRRKKDARYNRISPARRQKIMSRLQEFSETDLIKALDAVALDDWEGRNRADDITQIFRSHETVDRFLDLAANVKLMTPAERLRVRMAERGEE